MARRQLNPFGLAFLDCICCGFGAVILVFMIISHRINVQTDEMLQDLEVVSASLSVDVEALRKVMEEREKKLREALAARDATMQEVAKKKDAYKKAKKAHDDKPKKQGTTPEPPAPPSIPDPVVRPVPSSPTPSLLTGLKRGGRRVLVLVDASASMLDSTLINVIRMRYLSDEVKRNARKWRSVVSMTDWIASNIPSGGKFQMYTFDVEARSLVDGTDGTWLDGSNGKLLDQAMTKLRRTSPKGGTSLHAAFRVISRLQPKPDNVYLLTDGFPTQGATPDRRVMVTG